MNEQGYVPMKLYLWTLEFEIYIMFIYHDILYFSFQQFKYVKLTHSLQATEKQHGLWAVIC